MSVEQDDDEAMDTRSSAYLAILEVRDLLYAEGLGQEAEFHVEALVRLVQRTGRDEPPVRAPAPVARPRFGWRRPAASCHG